MKLDFDNYKLAGSIINTIDKYRDVFLSYQIVIKADSWSNQKGVNGFLELYKLIYSIPVLIS